MIQRKIALATAVFSLTATSFANPGLTTIRDVLYRVDGNPFEGSITIAWSSLNTGSTSSIGMPVRTRIHHGKLNVRLVNLTEVPAYYSVKYRSARTDEVMEVWGVPASPTPLRVKDVRVPAANQPSTTVRAAAMQPAASTPVRAAAMQPTASTTVRAAAMQPTAVQPAAATIPESSVINLVSDLGARPVEGPLFVAGRAAIIDSMGAIDGASGNLSACLHVDGSSGPCGTSPAFVDEEVPAGTVNGSNATFTTSASATPPTSLALYRNGIVQKAGLDYRVSGNTISFLAGSVPQAGDTLLASYRVASAGATRGAVGAEVLCSGTGTTTSSTTIAVLGSCNVPGGTLQPGDRVKISFDYSHKGSLTAGFDISVHWGTTQLLLRGAGASETLVSGWAEAGADATGSQLSIQSWGTALPAVTSLKSTSDSFASPILLTFQGDMAATTTDTLTLRNFSVVRYPKVP